MNVTENTVSRKTEAKALFEVPTAEDNRRRRRSAEPARAVGFQFERVYDLVGSEAIVLCDVQGRPLSAIGDDQLCRLLAKSVPVLSVGDARRVDYQLKAMDIIRPEIDFSHIAVEPIPVPHRSRGLFVASVSESTFNEAGVQHAGDGVRRILGIPEADQEPSVVSSRDRLAYDLERALEIGYQDFKDSELAQSLRGSRRRGASRRQYAGALAFMLDRVDKRLRREGLRADRPSLLARFWGEEESLSAGYRLRRFDLPLRFVKSGRQWGRLTVDMTCADTRFDVPSAPSASLRLVN
jgi:hypothetical protein